MVLNCSHNSASLLSWLTFAAMEKRTISGLDPFGPSSNFSARISCQLRHCRRCSSWPPLPSSSTSFPLLLWRLKKVALSFSFGAAHVHILLPSFFLPFTSHLRFISFTAAHVANGFFRLLRGGPRELVLPPPPLAPRLNFRRRSFAYLLHFH